MKNKLIYSILIISVLFGILNFSFASTRTGIRDSSNNYGVTKNIEMTSSRIYYAKRTPLVDSEEKIYDFADLFSDEEEKKLYKNAKEYIKETGFDIAIVTIDDNNKADAMSYADDFYDYNSFGADDGKDSGVLFLIDMQNRKMWISTTGKAKSVYTDSRINSILDNCESPIKSEKYFECADVFIISAKSEYTTDKVIGWVLGFFISGIISLLVPTIFCFVKKSKHKSVFIAKNADLYLERSSVNFTNKEDTFIKTRTTKTARPSSSSGGSSSHRGSSGVSHGGGGRSF